MSGKSCPSPLTFLLVLPPREVEWAESVFRQHAASGDTDAKRLVGGILARLERKGRKRDLMLAKVIQSWRAKAVRYAAHVIKECR